VQTGKRKFLTLVVGVMKTSYYPSLGRRDQIGKNGSWRIFEMKKEDTTTHPRGVDLSTGGGKREGVG